MKKITVSEEQAKALEYVENNDIKDTLLVLTMCGGFDKYNEKAIPLNYMDLGDVVTALIVGYEVEEHIDTPEEIVFGTYSEYQSILEHRKGDGVHVRSYTEGWLNGVDFVLRTLGIEIKGINK